MLVSSEIRTWTHFKVICRLFLSEQQEVPIAAWWCSKNQLLQASEWGERSPPIHEEGGGQAVPQNPMTPWKKLMTRASEQTGSTFESTLASGLLPWFCKAPFPPRLTSSKLSWSSRVGVDRGDRRRQTGQLLNPCNSVCNPHLVPELGYKMLHGATHLLTKRRKLNCTSCPFHVWQAQVSANVS